MNQTVTFSYEDSWKNITTGLVVLPCCTFICYALANQGNPLYWAGVAICVLVFFFFVYSAICRAKVKDQKLILGPTSVRVPVPGSTEMKEIPYDQVNEIRWSILRDNPALHLRHNNTTTFIVAKKFKTANEYSECRTLLIGRIGEDKLYKE